MAVTQENTKYTVRVEYKTSYDTVGSFPNLGDYSQTFSNVKETATPAQLKAFADALMSLTIYSGAPYKVTLIDTSELMVTE